MPQCPQCNKPLATLVRRCPTCQADLDLLVDFAGQLQRGIEKADALARSGDLPKSIWAYLEVLEADPDNPTARRQVAQVVTAIRQFDLSSPERRRAAGLPPEEPKKSLWRDVGLKVTLAVLLFAGIFSMGFLAGARSSFVAAPSREKGDEALPPDNTAGGAPIGSPKNAIGGK
jgi:hypothetical protein